MEKIATINHPRHFFRMIIVTIFVILIGTIAYATLRKKFTSQTTGAGSANGTIANSSNSNAVVTPAIFNPNKSWLSFSPDTSGLAQLVVNQNSSFIVKGFSEGKNIDGYDVLISVDPQKYEIVSIESVHPSFQIYQFKKETHVTITGVKQLSVTTPTIFAETPLLKVVIKPKKIGSAGLAFIDSVKKEQTKFVDEKVTVINPQLQSLTVEIKQ